MIFETSWKLGPKMCGWVDNTKRTVTANIKDKEVPELKQKSLSQNVRQTVEKADMVCRDSACGTQQKREPQRWKHIAKTPVAHTDTPEISIDGTFAWSIKFFFGSVPTVIQSNVLNTCEIEEIFFWTLSSRCNNTGVSWQLCS